MTVQRLKFDWSGYAGGVSCDVTLTPSVKAHVNANDMNSRPNSRPERWHVHVSYSPATLASVHNNTLRDYCNGIGDPLYSVHPETEVGAKSLAEAIVRAAVVDVSADLPGAWFESSNPYNYHLAVPLEKDHYRHYDTYITTKDGTEVTAVKLYEWVVHDDGRGEWRPMFIPAQPKTLDQAKWLLETLIKADIQRRAELAAVPEQPPTPPADQETEPMPPEATEAKKTDMLNTGVVTAANPPAPAETVTVTTAGSVGAAKFDQYNAWRVGPSNENFARAYGQVIDPLPYNFPKLDNTVMMSKASMVAKDTGPQQDPKMLVLDERQRCVDIFMEMYEEVHAIHSDEADSGTMTAARMAFNKMAGARVVSAADDELPIADDVKKIVSDAFHAK